MYWGRMGRFLMYVETNLFTVFTYGGKFSV